MNLYDFNGKAFYIDMKALISFLTTSSSDEKQNDTSITQIYAIDQEEMSNNDVKMVSKEVSETKSNINDTMVNIRYDLVKNLLNALIEPIQNENGGIVYINNLNEMNFAQTLCLNTLKAEGILKELNEE